MKRPYKPDFTRPLEIYTEFHRRELWGFLENLYTWEGMPEEVDIRFFNSQLITYGFAPLIAYKGGYVTSNGAPHGLDKYFRSTKFRISNPFLDNLDLEVGKKAVICYNTLNYRQPESCELLVEIYARRLAQIDLSLDVSLKNSRASIIAVVEDSNDALRVVTTLEDIYRGEAAAVTTSQAWKDSTQIFPLKPKDNIIAAELADSRDNVMAEFYQYLGIDTVAVDKKERTNLVEMHSQDQQLLINGKRMDEARDIFCEEVKKTFGLDITCKKNKPEEVRSDVEGMPETGIDTTAAAQS